MKLSRMLIKGMRRYLLSKKKGLGSLDEKIPKKYQ